MRWVPIDPGMAADEMRAAGLEPLEPYPGNNRPWPCLCTTCGSQVAPRLSSIRGGQGGCRACGARSKPRVDPEVAAAEVRAAGFNPLEPYPGRVRDRWRIRCHACGADLHVRLTDLRTGHGCRACSVQSRRTTPEEAAAVTAAAGLEPLEPFPGKPDRWWCRCLTCGRDSMFRFKNVKSGQSRCRTCAARR